MTKKLPLVLLMGGLVAASPVSLAYGPGPYAPYGHPAYAAPASVGGVNIRRVNLPEAYVLEIHLHDLKASDIEVKREGFWLRIHSSRQTGQDYSDGSGGYSFSHSFSNLNRKVRVPLDADMHGMERTDGEQLITIRVPKVRRY